MKYKLTFALMASLTSTAFAEFKAPLPEFKNEKQLAEWRAEQVSASTSKGLAVEKAAFYTGRPYLASSRDYAFKYRSYNPELARWSSEDPSGFPDGANLSAYAPSPTHEFDFMGLAKKSLFYQGSTSFKSAPFKELNPSVDGTISWEMNDAETHFTVSATGTFDNKGGDWKDIMTPDKQSAIFSTGAITQTNSGTEVVAGQTAWKKDWISFKVTLQLEIISTSGNHTVTSYQSHEVFSDKKYGNRYE